MINGVCTYMCVCREIEERREERGKPEERTNNMNCEYLDHPVKGGLESITWM